MMNQKHKATATDCVDRPVKKCKSIDENGNGKESNMILSVFDYDTEQIFDLLLLHGIDLDICTHFQNIKISGSDLKEWLTDHKNSSELQNVLNENYFKPPNKLLSEKDARHLLAIVKRYEKSPNGLKYKIIADCVHGQINIHPLLIRVIDTPQFQRLRFIKQLGCLNYVYPGAIHTRFEHSIGTSHLAGILMDHLASQQPSLKINKRDKFCVQLAGLCHDLGHGPFSHMFEQFLEKLDINDWKHEVASLKMFDKMMNENESLKLDFESFGLFEMDLLFIKDLIYNETLKSATDLNDYEQKLRNLDSLKERGIEKSFLFEIISNYRNGIDVDKFDYFGRDCLLMGFKNNFDHIRYISRTRVIKSDNSLNQICVRDKEVLNLYEMYHIREHLTRRAYKHETASSINLMLMDAFLKAESYFQFSTIIQTMDLERYEKLDDSILCDIRKSNDKRLSESKQIIDKLNKRDIYKYICSTVISSKFDREKFTDKDLEKNFKEFLSTESNNNLQTNDDVLVEIVKFNYGSKKKNPIENVRFYTKYAPNKPQRIDKCQVSEMLLEVFEDVVFRIYSKNKSHSFIEFLAKSFDRWCQAKGFPKSLHGSS